MGREGGEQGWGVHCCVFTVLPFEGLTPLSFAIDVFLLGVGTGIAHPECFV